MRDLGLVKRHDAERYVLISLVAFALTVVALRAILWLAGYPQIGEDTIHIAHVLWGGLGLFAASLLLLVVSNRWALVAGAVLSGGGVGLFIDEVGKFVTQSNNYFTPAAAPIIYGLFLATVLVYLHVRRPPRREARGEMYRALEQMSAVLDNRMTLRDLDALSQRLRMVHAASEEEATCALAASLRAFVESAQMAVATVSPRRKRGLSPLIDACRRRVIAYGEMRLLLVPLLLACGAYEILSVAPPHLLATSLVSDSIGFAVRAALQGGAGLAVIAGGLLIALRHQKRGAKLAFGGLIFGLTVTNLLVLYQDQFRGLVVTVLQCMALGAILSFRRVCPRPEAREPSL